MTRADQIFKRFRQFHIDHPEVWQLFKEYTFTMIKKGRKNYSVSLIYEHIRWHESIAADDRGIKLCNNYRAYYARMFHAAFPQYDGFFIIKSRPSKKKQAYTTELEYIETPQEVPDETLMKELKQLSRIHETL